MQSVARVLQAVAESVASCCYMPRLAITALDSRHAEAYHAAAAGPRRAQRAAERDGGAARVRAYLLPPPRPPRLPHAHFQGASAPAWPACYRVCPRVPARVLSPDKVLTPICPRRAGVRASRERGGGAGAVQPGALCGVREGGLRVRAFAPSRPTRATPAAAHSRGALPRSDLHNPRSERLFLTLLRQLLREEAERPGVHTLGSFLLEFGRPDSVIGLLVQDYFQRVRAAAPARPRTAR